MLKKIWNIYSNTNNIGLFRTVLNLFLFIIILLFKELNQIIVFDGLSIIDYNYIGIKLLKLFTTSFGAFILYCVLQYAYDYYIALKDTTCLGVINKGIIIFSTQIFISIAGLIWVLFFKTDAFTIVHYSNYIEYTGLQLLKFNIAHFYSSLSQILYFIFLIIIIFNINKNDLDDFRDYDNDYFE